MKKESNYAKDKKPNIRAYALDIIINVVVLFQIKETGLLFQGFVTGQLKGQLHLTI